MSAPMEGIFATTAAMNALFLEEEALAAASLGADGGDGIDLLDRFYRNRLERLGLEKRLEAQVAALKARDAVQCLDLQQAMTPPGASTHDRTYAEISAVEEIAGILTVSSGAAAAFLAQSRRVCSLPTAFEALSTGSLSWQHARVIADETENLDHAGAVALADHFLDPDAPNPARGCPAGQLVPSRLRSKVRSWRERHHPESIEKRHAKGVADRRVEFTPDRDGMAWISAYLPADSALAAWNRTTAIARGLQGPNETRTLTQIKADEFTRRLLSTGTTATAAGRTAGASGAGVSGAGVSGAGVSGADDRIPDTNSAGACHTGIRTPGRASHDNRAAVQQLPEGFIGLATLDGSDEPAADLGIPDALAAASMEAGSAGDHGTTSLSDPATGAFPGDPEVGKIPTPRADVIVTVPVFALFGQTDEPASLDGYGPIPASMARKLLTEGADSFTRVLVDPRDGAPLEIGRTSYRITKAMRQALALRDGKCTFPGCNNNALDNDADHLTAWQDGGTTGISNLAQLCPKHHRLKHNSGWTPTEATRTKPPGWTSPTGRHYTSEQPDREQTIWPDSILVQEMNNVPRLLEPPCEEPEDNNLIDAGDIAPYDPAWDDFYAMPIVLPPDPQKDMALENWDSGNCIPVLT